MRKTAICLFFLFTLSTVSILHAANDLDVSGITNPSAANGKYLHQGTLYDHDYWKHESEEYYIYYHQYAGGDQHFYWNIDIDTDDTDVLFYSNDDPDESSPALVTSWISLSGAGSPTVTEIVVGAPEINVKGNGSTIFNGDDTPSFNDHTKFGSADISSGTATRTYTIENSGTVNLTIDSVTFSGAAASDFSVTTAPSATIAGSSSTTFVVTFDPSALGNRNATVSIANNDSDENPYTFDIQGYGSTPKDLVVSDITNPAAANGDYTYQGILYEFQYWKHVSENYYIYNDEDSGSRYWNIDDNTDDANYLFYFSSEAGSPVGLTPWTLGNFGSPEGSPVITEAIPAPDINVQGNGVSIPDDDISPTVIDHTNFGSLNVSSGTRARTFTIQNTGGATLNLSGSSPYVTISGAGASDFSVTTPPSATIASTGSTTFVITFDPSVAETRTATISISSDDSDESPYNFDIQGDGFTPKDLTVSDITTPAAANGNYAHQGILYEFQYWKHVSENYYVYNDEYTNATRYWNIDTDTDDAVVNFYSNNFNEDASPVNVTSWHAEAGNDGTPNVEYSGPEIKVEGNSVEISDGDTTPSTTDHTDFGKIDFVSGSITRTFTIYNEGSDTLTISSITLSSETHFSITSSIPASVAAGGNETIDVKFDPASAGEHTVTLTINNNDGDESAYDFSIMGTGLAPPVISNLDGDSLSYNEGEGAVVLEQGTAATMTDTDSSDFDGGNLTATISAGEDLTEDVLSVDTSGTVSLTGTTAGSDVSVGGTIIGTLGNDIAPGNDLVVNFNGNANSTNITILIQALTYENIDTDNPTAGARTIDVTVNDGDGGTSTPASVTVTVSGVNEDPQITGLPTDITVTEETESNVDLSAATFSDVDSGAGDVTVTLAAGSGTLSGASGGGVTVAGSGTGTLTLTGTAANIDTFLNTASNITYTGATDVTGDNADTITVTANDGGNTGTGGGTDVSLGTVNVDIMAVNAPPEVRESIPHHNAGIDDSTRIPNNTSFAVRIEDSDGIDVTDTASIKFTVNDTDNVYERDLSDGSVRVVKLSGDPDTELTKLWAVYDRSVDEYGNYIYDTNINIKVDVRDRKDESMSQESYDFNIETEEEYNEAQANLPVIGDVDPTDPALEGDYDAGGQVESEDLKGAKIIYDSSEPVTPVFGPTDELPALDIAGVWAVGVAINLQPPTIFNTPVKIFIPCPYYANVSGLGVYLYNGLDWVLACDADGNVQSAGDGWMVPGSRVNHNDGYPSTIEIRVYHFSGVQAGFSDGAGDDGCFIATAAYGSPMEPHVKVLREFRDRFLLTNSAGKAFVSLYYTYSPPMAGFIFRHDTVRFVVRWVMMPLVGISWMALHPGSMATLLFLVLISATAMMVLFRKI